MIKQQSAFHSVQRLCRAFSLSTSGYYRWIKCPVGKRQREDQDLSEDIKRIFKKSRSTYGSPRMQRALREEGKRHGKMRLRRLMKKLNLKPKAARRFKVTTDSKHNKPVAPNILGQRFSPPAANVAWAADITHIRTDEGWLYLATVIDLYSRRIIGWSMGTRLLTKLVADALTMALLQRKPPHGAIHHSDRGSQYCSDAYQALLSKHGFVCSMSGKGNCYDNAVMESFYHTIKVELVYGQHYRTRDEAQTAVFDYIEIFYNRQRLHSSLDYQTPEAFERAA
jgi:transposase InsO family protein